jgi:predicted transcriptional regulator
MATTSRNKRKTARAGVQTATTSLKLDVELKGRLRELSEARRRTPHWLMTEAVRQYVEREEKREKFKQDAVKAWEHYQATGLHVTAEEADAWLEKLANGELSEAPECHS